MSSGRMRKQDLARKIVSKLIPRETRGIVTSLNQDSSGRTISASVALDGGATTQVSGAVALGVSRGALVALSTSGPRAAPSYTITRVVQSGFGVGSTDPNGFLSSPTLFLINGDFPQTVNIHPVTKQVSLTVDFSFRIIPEQRNQGIKIRYEIEVIDPEFGYVVGRGEIPPKSRVMGGVAHLEANSLIIEPIEFLGQSQSMDFPPRLGVVKILEEEILYDTAVKGTSDFSNNQTDGDQLAEGPIIVFDESDDSCVVRLPFVRNVEYYELKIIDDIATEKTTLARRGGTVDISLPDTGYAEYEVVIVDEETVAATKIRRGFNGTPLHDESAQGANVATLVSDTITIHSLPGNRELEAKVRAVAYDGRTSNWSSTVSFTTTYDITPPPVPSNIVVISYTEHLYLPSMSSDREVVWDRVYAEDLDYYEIQRSEDGVLWDVNTIRKVIATSVLLSDQESQSSYRVRSVDKSGNKSAWGYPVSFDRRYYPKWHYQL